jgi:hypothetical protein
MDKTLLPLILGAIGTLIATVTAYLQRRRQQEQDRFKVAFDAQSKTMDDLRAENIDQRTRITNTEKALHENTLKLVECERDKGRLELKVERLLFRVDELQKLIPNGTAL